MCIYYYYFITGRNTRRWWYRSTWSDVPFYRAEYKSTERASAVTSLLREMSSVEDINTPQKYYDSWSSAAESFRSLSPMQRRVWFPWMVVLWAWRIETVVSQTWWQSSMQKTSSYVSLVFTELILKTWHLPWFLRTRLFLRHT